MKNGLAVIPKGNGHFLRLSAVDDLAILWQVLVTQNVTMNGKPNDAWL